MLWLCPWFNKWRMRLFNFKEQKQCLAHRKIDLFFNHLIYLKMQIDLFFKKKIYNISFSQITFKNKIASWQV